MNETLPRDFVAPASPDDLALGGFMEKPPARRRRHEVPAPSDNFRSFISANQFVARNAA